LTATAATMTLPFAFVKVEGFSVVVQFQSPKIALTG
jgi:hypothetical protein